MRFACLLLLMAFPCVASTYYVDYGSGNDANGGTGTGDAWKHCPGDSAYTGGTTLATGDTVYFKLGVTYTDDSPSTALSGTIGTQADGVTYTVKSDWGTGAAVIDGSTSENWSVFMVRHNNTHILGLSTNYELRVTGEKSWHGIHVPWKGTGETAHNDGLVVRYVYVDGIGTNSVTFVTGPDGIKLGGGTSFGAINALVEYSKFLNCEEYGIKFSGINNSNVIGSHCILSGNLSPDTQFNVSGTAHKNTIVEYCEIYNSGPSSCNGLNVNESQTTVRYNKIYNNTGYGISLGFTTVDLDGLIDIYGNEIHNNTDRSIGIGTGSTSVRYSRIYNNIFYGNGSFGITLSDSGGCSFHRIWNNTFYEGVQSIRISASGSTDNEIKNNIFYGTGSALCMYAVSGSIINSDNNIYYKSSGNLIQYGATTYTASTFADYQAAVSPQEAGSVSDNPDLTNPGANVFTLIAGSPAIDNGANLSAYFSTDFLGYTRSSIWDIGAYEYVPLGPNYMRATTASAGTVRLR